LKPVEIINDGESDRIVIRHNDIEFDYYVDSESNLIKKVKSIEKIVATNIKSIKTTETRSNMIVVTISSYPESGGEIEGVQTMSKTYSISIDLKNTI
jgi:hypothetical protein